MNAKAELVVARALKPSASNTLAEPASHGFGITKGVALVQRAEVGRLARLGRRGVVGRHSGSLSVAVGSQLSP